MIDERLHSRSAGPGVPSGTMIQRQNYRDYRVPAGRIFAPSKFRRALDLVPLVSESFLGRVETQTGQSSDEVFGGAKLLNFLECELMSKLQPLRPG